MVNEISSRGKFRAEIGRPEMNIVLSTGHYFALQRKYAPEVFRMWGNNVWIDFVEHAN